MVGKFELSPSAGGATKGGVFVAERLTKTYVTGEVTVQALRGIDLEIWGGEVVVLLGPSGSGKSTLLNILGGLDHATSGRLLFRDTELTALDDRGLTRYRRDHVGFVFLFYNLVPSLTAYENVALVTEIADHPMRPEEALGLVGRFTVLFGMGRRGSKLPLPPDRRLILKSPWHPARVRPWGPP